jgi:HAD superfamily hydrolase (TIGR01509 family)
MPARAVLFDMDGVLVDSEHYWVARERDHILPDAVAGDPPRIGDVTGMNYREIYEYVAEHHEPVVSQEEFLATYEDAAETVYGDEVALLDGVEGLLDDLRAAGVTTAIVSSSPHDWIDLVRDRFGLHDAFDAVVSAEDVDAPGKPAPDVYEYAAAVVDVAPEDCVAVEDSEHGVASAVAAGMTVVGYRSGADDTLDLSGADVVVDTPAALLAAVRARTLD